MRGFYGILLIVALVAVSGLIAYIGDILGRRLGRRRLSLFGLRPRHTAIVVSVIAGMLITLFTLAMAMVVSQNVKDGFLKVDYMRQRQKELSREVDSLNRRIADLDKSRRGLETQLKRGQDELAKGQAQLADAKAALEETRTARDKTVAELQQKQDQLARTKVALAKSAADLKNATGAFTRMTKALNDMSQQVDALKLFASQTEREYALERAVPILFGAGQPLDVDLMAGGQSTADAHRELNAFIARLDTKVIAAGARPLAGSKEAVLIRKPVEDPKTNQVTVARSYQVMDAVASRVHESQGDVIVRAYSVFNTHAREPVYVDFELFRNLLVFRKGEVLAETVMDGQLSDSALLDSLVRLLKDDVGAKARGKNVMPRLNPSSPSLFETGGERVGEMTFDDLFRVIEKLRRVGGPARVTAVAADDTWTIGPLKVDLRVDPVTIASSR